MIYLMIAEEWIDLIDEATLQQAATATLAHQGRSADEVDLSIAIEDDVALHQLNHEFLGIDAPTDVLSFGSEEIDPDSGRLYLGDIIISLPRARVQAETAGHTLAAELQLLVTHGTLHLLGHDHAETDEKDRMWNAQRQILTQLGCHLAKFPD